jgi:hypothetical protein
MQEITYPGGEMDYGGNVSSGRGTKQRQAFPYIEKLVIPI